MKEVVCEPDSKESIGISNYVCPPDIRQRQTRVAAVRKLVSRDRCGRCCGICTAFDAGLLYFRVPVGVLDALLLVQNLANVPGKAADDGPRLGSLPFNWGDQDGILGSLLHPSPTLAIVGI